jgi:hypothetical protein
MQEHLKQQANSISKQQAKRDARASQQQLVHRCSSDALASPFAC